MTDNAHARQSNVAPPSKLHRVNGHEAIIAVLQASAKVRDGRWIRGAPSHVLADLLTELASRGYYLGVEDRDAP